MKLLQKNVIVSSVVKDGDFHKKVIEKSITFLLLKKNKKTYRNVKDGEKN